MIRPLASLLVHSKKIHQNDANSGYIIASG